MSWLNIAELEFAVLGRTVFKKRIADRDQLQRALDGICAHRNVQAKPVQWQFNFSKTRAKMAWIHPNFVNESTCLLPAHWCVRMCSGPWSKARIES